MGYCRVHSTGYGAASHQGSAQQQLNQKQRSVCGFVCTLFCAASDGEAKEQKQARSLREKRNDAAATHIKGPGRGLFY